METIYCGISGKEKLISLDDVFLTVLDSYIFGEITLEEMEERINHFKYL